MVALAQDPQFHVRLAALAQARRRDIWRTVRRPSQVAPPGDWRVWLLMAGRGFGKTRVGAEWIRERVQGVDRRIALVGATFADVRDTMIEGESGIIECCRRYGIRANHVPSKQRVEFSNGALAFTYSADEPDRLRGPQHESAWCVAAGTLVMTDQGLVPIESVRPGVQAWTRSGWHRVTAATLTRRDAPVLCIRTSDGDAVRLTENHKVFTRNRGWIMSQNVSPCDILDAWRYDTDHRHGLNGKASAGIGGKRAITPTAQGRCSMSRSGNVSTAGGFPPIQSSTTTTKTRQITTPRILLRCLAVTMLACTLPVVAPIIHGLKTPKAKQQALGQKLRGTFGNLVSLRASVAEWNTSRSECGRSSVPRLARRATVVVSVDPSGQADVWDLTVDGAHEFYAGGVLVHNCDEIGTWRYGEASWSNLDFGLRLGTSPQIVATSTPRVVQLVRDLIKRADIGDPDVVLTRGTTWENRDNIPAATLRSWELKYGGTRLGRQELEGELLEDVEGAMWTLDMIDRARLSEIPEGVTLVVCVVGVDPAATSKSESAETGIVVVARGSDGDGYVLGDYSLRGTPNTWGGAAIQAYRDWRADHITPETNNGGEMVVNTLQTIDPNVPVNPVHASRGKATRAEPVSALYEQGRVHHIGTFPELEDQMATWVPGMASPDRMDALVWGATDALLEGDAAFTDLPKETVDILQEWFA